MPPIRFVLLACAATLATVACMPLVGAGTAPTASATTAAASPSPAPSATPPTPPAPPSPPPRQPEPIQSTTMLGDLVYMADAARITLCDVSSLPFAMEADWIRMERAYTATVKPAGSPLHVSFEGHVAKRPTMEGDGTEAAILVTRFIRAWPGENCERSRADASLVETYWRAVLLAGLEAGTVAGRKEPQLRLRAGEAATHAAGDYTATVGCNVVSGRYSVNVASLRFAAGAMTRMACPPPLDALERGLVDTLSRTASWRIKGPTLELFDAGGASVGLFQAVYLK